MPDNPNFFDDDNLLPDWMRDDATSPGGDPFDLPDSTPGESARANAAVPPWEQFRGQTPARPGLTPAVPPWETYEGDRPAAPASLAAGAPWETSRGGETRGGSGLGDLRAAIFDDDTEQEDLDEAFSWGATGSVEEEPLSDSDDLPRGLTDMLPWRESAAEQQEPPAAEPPNLAEQAGLSENRFTMGSLIDEFQSDAPAEAEPPAKPPSLRDRLRSASPSRNTPPPEPTESAEPDEPTEPPALRAEESEWMSAFGQSPEYTGFNAGTPEPPESANADLDWLSAEPEQDAEQATPPEEPAPSADDTLADEFAELFDDELGQDFDLETPQADGGPVAEPANEDEFAVMFGEEFSEEFLSAEQDFNAGEPEDAGEPRSVSEWMEEDASLFEESAAEEPAATPPPETPAPPTRTGVIRRLATAPLEEKPPAENAQDSGEGEVPDWVTQAAAPRDEGPKPDMGGLTYDEWEQLQRERQQAEQQPPKDDLLEAVPDWFNRIDITPPPPTAPDAPKGDTAEFVPGWFMGLEEKKDEPTPDWFRQMDLTTGPLTGPLESPEPKQPAPAEPEVPDWFKAPDLPGVEWTPPSAPEPRMEAFEPGMDEDRAGHEQGEDEVPDWLSSAMPDEEMLAGPENIPFPELDLDQTMPGLPLMPDMDTMMGRKPNDESEQPEDFVERFEPLEVEPATPVRAPVDNQAPDWLREMAVEAGMPFDTDESEELSDEMFDAPPARAAADDSMDWLTEISADDLASEAEDMSWAEPAETEQQAPEHDLYAAESLDSGALNALLGIDEEQEAEPSWNLPVVTTPRDIQDVFGDLEHDTDSDLPAIPEITGMPDPFAEKPDEEFQDMRALFEHMPPGGDETPDLAVLFDQSDLDNVLGDEGAPAQTTEGSDEAEEAEHRALPTAEPRFGRFRKRKALAETNVKPSHPSTPEEEAPPLSATPQPEWVGELRPSDLPVTVRVGEVEANIKQKQVVELPDRLQAFRNASLRELEGVEAEPTAPPATGSLAGVTSALPIADVLLPDQAVERRGEQLVLTAEQRRRVNKLQAMLDMVAAQEEEIEEDRAGLDEAAQMTLGEFEPGQEPGQAAQARRIRRARRFKLDRVLVTLVMLLAVLSPFATDVLHFAADPPPLKGSRQVVADATYALLPGDYVLVAFEYGPTAAGELDGLAEAVLRDVLAHRAIPLTTSTNTAGAFHAGAVLGALANDPALLAARGQQESGLIAGKDYMLLSYLSGEAVGVRNLRHLDSAVYLQGQPMFKYDVRGDTIDLPITSLENDIALLIVVAEDSDAVRLWAEQLKGVAVPKIALVTAAAEPLTTPYVGKDGYAGYLAGVRDMYSYDAARNTESRAAYVMPGDLPVTLPDPEQSRWHSMALGAAAASGLIIVGLLVNVFRGLGRRRRR